MQRFLVGGVVCIERVKPSTARAQRPPSPAWREPPFSTRAPSRPSPSSPVALVRDEMMSWTKTTCSDSCDAFTRSRRSASAGGHPKPPLRSDWEAHNPSPHAWTRPVASLKGQRLVQTNDGCKIQHLNSCLTTTQIFLGRGGGSTNPSTAKASFVRVVTVIQDAPRATALNNSPTLKRDGQVGENGASHNQTLTFAGMKIPFLDVFSRWTVDLISGA